MNEPYWNFFYALEDVLLRVGASFQKNAIHLDLVPWATMPAWSGLDANVRNDLLELGRPHFRATLNKLSSLTHLFANGSEVTNQLWLMNNNHDHIDWGRLEPPYALWKLTHWDWHLSDKRKLRVVGWNHFLPRQHMSDEAKGQIVQRCH